MLTPSATRFVGPLSFAALSRHPVETDAARPAPRRADRPHRRRRHGRRDRRRPRHRALARRDGRRSGRGRRDRHVPRDLGAGRRRAGDGRRHVDATPRRSPTSRGCARSATRSSSPTPVRSRRASRASGGSPSCRPSSTPSSRPSAIARSVPRIRPPARRSSNPARDADLAGRHIVVTAGGTREAIDPVRFIGNRSTGKMGVAIAEAALDRGARVTLIAAQRRGPLPARRDGRPGRVDRRPARRPPPRDTRRRRRGRLRRPGHGRGGRRLPAGDPAQTRSSRVATRSRSSSSRPPTCWPRSAGSPAASTATARATREPLRPLPVLVGFAAETGSLERAAEKLRRKGVDLLVANDVAEPGSGFGTDTNRVSILAADGSREDLPLHRSAPSPTACWTGWPRAGRARRRRADWCHDRADTGASMSATPKPEETVRRLTVVDIAQAVRRRHAHPDADRVRLPDGPDPRRGRHPDAPRRRFARPGRCSATRRPSG